MKLRSRRRRDKMKLWNRVGRGQGVTSLHFAYPFPCFAPSTTSFHSLFLRPASPTYLLLRSILPAATCRQAAVPAILSPAVLLLPFFFIKLPKRQSGSVAVALCPASRSSCGGRPARRTLVLHQIRCRGSSPVLMASSLWRLEL